jgi:membrane fusion protein
MSELRNQKNLTIGLASSEQTSLGAQRTSAQQAIVSLEKQKELLARQIRLDESQQSRIRRLLAQGVGTKVELEEAERSVLASRLNFEGTAEKIIDKREQLATLTVARSTRGMNGIQSESEIEGRIAAIAQERATLLRQDRLVLQAPIDGEIGDIAMNVGQSTSSDGSIVSVIPKKSKLEVQLLAPSSAVGFVKPGQNVKLKFDAFPYEKYGVGQGVVTWVSTVPTDHPVVDGKPATPEPVFRVRVSIDSRGFDKKLPKGQLRAGMTLSANLILEERSLWEAFLGPIFKAVGS